MPIHVDSDERRAAIARATLEVAAQGGLSAVTIRSVAARLGASTTFITNYVPTRTALLVNALRQVEEEWLAELEEALAGEDPVLALRAAVRSVVQWDAEEMLRSQFWIAVLAVPDRDSAVEDHLIESTAAARAVFAKLVDQCGHPNPATAADILMLFAQGSFVSIVETPGQWSQRRLREAADAAVDAVLAQIE